MGFLLLVHLMSKYWEEVEIVDLCGDARQDGGETFVTILVPYSLESS